MANIEHVEILEKGVAEWNRWREEHPHARPDLSGALLHGARLHDIYFHWANLSGTDLHEGDLWGAQFEDADLRRANLRDARLLHAYLRRANIENARLAGANLEGANLGDANLRRADLSGANLRGANLENTVLCEANLAEADMEWADCSEADMRRAVLARARIQESDFYGANLSFADLSGAVLSEVDLSCCSLVEANLRRATLADCRVYGTANWNVALDDATQYRLTITQLEEPDIVVDDLSIAASVYRGIRDASYAALLAPKVVLVVGTRTAAQSPATNALCHEIRNRGYWPVLVNAEGRASSTMPGLAHLGRHALVDLAGGKDAEALAGALVANRVQVQPILAMDAEALPGVWSAVEGGSTVKEAYHYRGADDLGAVVPRLLHE